jgi:hypothetical protein
MFEMDLGGPQDPQSSLHWTFSQQNHLATKPDNVLRRAPHPFHTPPTRQ